MDLAEAKLKLPAIYTIYNRPADYPDKIVVVRWYGEFRDCVVWLGDSLAEAREMIWNLGADFPMVREAADDPTIVESWI